MKKKFRFTTTLLKALPVNPPDARATELEFSDTEVIGLKCLSGKSGSKRFLLRYVFQRRKTSIAIGRFPDVDVATARKVARQYKADIAQGVDPKASRNAGVNSPQFPTVRTFFYDTWLPLAKKRKRSWRDDKARFLLCQSIHDIPYDELTAQQILEVQLNLSSDTEEHYSYAAATCNRVIALLKTIGFANSEATEPEVKVEIPAGHFATSPPQYWHRIEMTDDAQFNINFWSETDKQNQPLFSAKK